MDGAADNGGVGARTAESAFAGRALRAVFSSSTRQTGAHSRGARARSVSASQALHAADRPHRGGVLASLAESAGCTGCEDSVRARRTANQTEGGIRST